MTHQLSLTRKLYSKMLTNLQFYKRKAFFFFVQERSNTDTFSATLNLPIKLTREITVKIKKGKVLVNHFTRLQSEILIICQKNKVWNASFHNIRHNNIRQCKHYIITKNIPPPFYTYQPMHISKDLHWRQLSIYCGIAICDRIQHLHIQHNHKRSKRA